MQFILRITTKINQRIITESLWIVFIKLIGVICVDPSIPSFFVRNTQPPLIR